MKQRRTSEQKQADDAKYYTTRYNEASGQTIYSAYDSISDRKKEIWQSLCRLKDAQRGYDLRVIAYNCHFFTAAYRYRDDNDKEMLRIFTAYRDFCCPYVTL